MHQSKTKMLNVFGILLSSVYLSLSSFRQHQPRSSHHTRGATNVRWTRSQSQQSSRLS